MKYKTRQRDEIFRVFESRPSECLTAREVMAQVSAGEATVFRALTALSEEGLIRKFSGESGACYRYAECGGGHLHLRCEECGKIIHLDCEFLSEISSHFLREHGFALNSGKTVILGRCESCRG